LETTKEVCELVDRRFEKLLVTEDNPNAPLLSFTNRMGRAEEDEHAMGVNVAEYVISLNPNSGISREGLIALLTEQVEEIPGIQHEVEQPIAHLISHMLSGVHSILSSDSMTNSGKITSR
jgi:HME family heavy-metal exporter